MNYTSDEKRKIVKEDYNAIADTYAKCYSEIDYCKTYIDEFIANLSGKKVLDIGCGAGQITDYLTQKGFEVIGLDFSHKLLKIAKRNFPNSKFILADICEYEQNEQVDGIITKDVLFHLSDENLVSVLQKFRRMIKPNGNLCIIMDMPKEAGEQIFVEELDEKYQIYYNYLTPEKLRDLLEKTGFNIENIQLVKDNDNASSYATGLMIFQVFNSMICENKM